MGGCQNYGPLLGTLNIRCSILVRIQKGTITLTTTRMIASILKPHELASQPGCTWTIQQNLLPFSGQKPPTESSNIQSFQYFYRRWPCGFVCGFSGSGNAEISRVEIQALWRTIGLHDCIGTCRAYMGVYKG